MKISCYIPYSPYSERICDEISIHKVKCYLIIPEGLKLQTRYNILSIKTSYNSSESIKKVIEQSLMNEDDKSIVITSREDIHIDDKFWDILPSCNNEIFYSNYYKGKEEFELNPFQKGSVRSDFDYGHLIIIPNDIIKYLSKQVLPNLKYSGLYWLTLNSCKKALPSHISQALYTINEKSNAARDKSEEIQFDYLDPSNKEVQLEYEKIVTDYLKDTNAFINYQELKEIQCFETNFKTDASVIIPVYNRENTIGQAIQSALSQEFNKSYNVIVVDNHSTDHTTQIIEDLRKNDNRIIHIIPKENNLGIGGCWNKALLDNNCGKFAIQLDSDDIYSKSDTIQKIVDAFYFYKCAMVIGSYEITDFNLNRLPPGIIDHKEWSDKNGMNNALRINGLGAPRAFYTTIARQILFKNCSYGEDYAMGLAISRQFKIGRIFDIIYTCRRWGGNSDSNLTQKQINKNNLFKDSIRTEEIEKRELLNKFKL